MALYIPNTWFFYTMPTRKASTNADWFLMSHFLSFVETTTNSLGAFFVMPTVRFVNANSTSSPLTHDAVRS